MIIEKKNEIQINDKIMVTKIIVLTIIYMSTV
jgi:hypothetical protein